MVEKLKPKFKGAKKMAEKKTDKANEKKTRKPRSPATGPRRAVIVQLEDGSVRNLAPYCKEIGLSVGTVYLRLKKRLEGCQDDAVMLRSDDAVLCSDRQPPQLKVYAIKDGHVCRMQYAEAIRHTPELIISKHGWKANEAQQWQDFHDALPEIAINPVDDADEAVAEVAEEVEDEALVS
jgi:hypothetical protein